MNIRKLCIAIAVSAVGIVLIPDAEAGRRGGGGHGGGHAFGHSGGFGGGGQSFSRGGSFQHGGGSNFRGGGVSHGSYSGGLRGHAINPNGGGMGTARIGSSHRTFDGDRPPNGGMRNVQGGSNHRGLGARTVAIANGNGRFRTGTGSHQTWGGVHHGSDHHSRHHHHDFGYGYGLAGFGFGYPYGYGYGRGYGYGGYGYGNSYNSGISAADVQQALAEQGYYRGAIDGVVGYGTMQAIRAFQANNGLQVTGRIDSSLVRALGF